MQQLAEEEARRQRGRITEVNNILSLAPNGVKRITNGVSAKNGTGTFWSKLDAEEKSRQGSVVSGPRSTAGKKQKGTFWQDLEAAENKRTAPISKGNFWDDLKTEENSRYGTVVTLSSDASTAVASM